MSADGKWEISMNTPMGAQSGTLDLKEDGTTLTGTMTAAAAPDTMEITDGTVDGNAHVEGRAHPADADHARVRGNRRRRQDLRHVKLGTFGDATFEGTRS